MGVPLKRALAVVVPPQPAYRPGPSLLDVIKRLLRIALTVMSIVMPVSYTHLTLPTTERV